jgi:hypothetical protein
MRAVTNDGLSECVALTEARGEGEFRKRRPLYVRNLFTRMDAIVGTKIEDDGK